MERNSRLLIANWKMHGTLASVQALLIMIRTAFNSSKMKRRVKNNPNNTVVILSPAIFMQLTAQLLQGSMICWGGQTMANTTEGAYTGEISGAMLKEFGCRYVLLGHSERRQYYKETNADIKEKCELALKLGLTPIICCGETLGQQEKNETNSVLQQQLSDILELGKPVLSQIAVAYEPVWAIGTGLSAHPSQVQETHAYIRSLIAEAADTACAKNACILYGGSVNSDNAKAFFELPDVNGSLVGGASLNAEEFLKIYHSFSPT